MIEYDDLLNLLGLAATVDASTIAAHITASLDRAEEILDAADDVANALKPWFCTSPDPIFLAMR